MHPAGKKNTGQNWSDLCGESGLTREKRTENGRTKTEGVCWVVVLLWHSDALAFFAAALLCTGGRCCTFWLVVKKEPKRGLVQGWELVFRGVEGIPLIENEIKDSTHKSFKV